MRFTPARIRVAAMLIGAIVLVSASAFYLATTSPEGDLEATEGPTLTPIDALNRTVPPVRLGVLGETHGTLPSTRALVDLAVKAGAVGCVCLGDFIFGDTEASPATWKSMMSELRSPLIAAQGNDDWPWSDWQDLFPAGDPFYVVVVNGVQFIVLNPEYSPLADGSPQRDWLDAVLESRPPEALKVLVIHRPWWLPPDAAHPTAEFEERTKMSATALDALVVKHGVDVVIAGHERNYQHSVRDRVHYIVQGASGPAFDKMRYELPGAVAREGVRGYGLLDVSPTRIAFEWRLANNTRTDAFIVGAAATANAFRAEFEPYGGNDWWVQTRVLANDAVTRVEARVNGAAWTRLSPTATNTWGAVMYVAPESVVQFRATNIAGDQVLSPLFRWPSGVPLSSAPRSDPDISTVSSGPATSPPTSEGPSPSTSGPSSSTSTSGGSTSSSSTNGDSTGGGTNPPTYTTPPSSNSYTPPSNGYTYPFSATFTPHDGNAWWVQTRVSSNEPVAQVFARVNGGSWISLDRHWWGSWAKSFYVEDGAVVEFKALSESGYSAESPWFRWPDGALPLGGTPGVRPEFADPSGTYQHIRATVRGYAHVTKVDVRIGDGPWIALGYEGWNVWGGYYEIPTGVSVQLRARTYAGSVAYSWSGST